MDNAFDNTKAIDYNTELVNDDNVMIVKMDEQRPVNDISCKHETLIADPDDRIGGAIYHGCANQKCGVGFYIKK